MANARSRSTRHLPSSALRQYRSRDSIGPRQFRNRGRSQGLNNVSSSRQGLVARNKDPLTEVSRRSRVGARGKGRTKVRIAVKGTTEMRTEAGDAIINPDLP